MTAARPLRRLLTRPHRPVAIVAVAVLGAGAVAAAGVVAGVTSAAAATGGELVVHQQFLDFGLHPVGTPAPSQVVTLENAGTAAVDALVVTAPDAPFGRTTTCGTTLAAGATCSVTFTFTATTGGTVTGSSAVTSDAGSATVALTGTGRDDPFPVVASPVAQDFGTVPVGATSAPQAVAVTNTSTATVNVQVAGGGVASEDFSGSTSCGGTFVTLAAGASCTLQYSFHPTRTGPLDASTTIALSLFSNDPAPVPTGVSRNVPLSFAGTGLFGIAVSPRTLDFGTVPVGAGSAPQQVRVVNTTASTLRVQVAGGGVASPDVTGSTSCGGTFVTLAAGASCTLQYTFRPTATGARSAATTVGITPFDANGDPLPASRNVALSFAGTGAWGFAVTPTSIDFGDRAVGDSSPSEQVRVVNTTASTLRVQVAGGAPAGGDFTGSTSCGGTFVTLAAGDSCSVQYAFRPTTTGPRSGDTTLGITPFDDAGQPLAGASRNVAVQLRGNGVADPAAAFPVVVLSARYDFGSTAVGATSPPQDVRVVNASNATVNVQVAGGGPSSSAFSGATGCGGTFVTLAAGASCTIRYSFTPQAFGAASATTNLSLTRYTDGADPQPTGSSVTAPVELAGTGVSGVAVVSRELDLGPVPVGTVGATQLVEVRNQSPQTLQVQVAGGGVGGGDFSGSTGCGGTFVTIAPGATCALQYVAQPRSLGAVTGTTTLGTVAYRNGDPISGSSETFGLSFAAVGYQPFTLSPTGLAFGDVAVGATSAPQQVVVTNTGPVTARVQVAGGGPNTSDFTGSTGCGGTFVTLAAGASCSLTYAARPGRSGPVNGSTTVQLTDYDESGNPTSAGEAHALSFAVTGSGDGPRLSVSPLSFDFGPQTVGSTSSPLTSTVTNDGTAPATGLAVVPPSGDFSASTTCGATLDAGTSCTVSWRYTPGAAGGSTGSGGVR